MTEPAYATRAEAAEEARALQYMISDTAAGDPLPDDALSIAADVADYLEGPTRPRHPSAFEPFLRYGAVTVYVLSVVLANWLTTRYGFLDVGFGQAATAGTFAAGGALVVRDVVQDSLGRWATLLLIAVAALTSYAVADHAVAVASGVAFGASELLDQLVYTPLRKRGEFGGPWWARGVMAGAIVGAVLDTVLFLWIAFGWDVVGSGLPGQLIAKGDVVLVLLALGVMGRDLLRQPLDAGRA